MKGMCKNVLFFDWHSFCLNWALGCVFASKDYIGSHYLGL
jgi:prepilin-type processing-associated H-X9-DG protein